jgi:hypothetical protein
MVAIPTLGRLRQEELKFEASLGSIASKTLSQNKTKQKQQ